MKHFILISFTVVIIVTFFAFNNYPVQYHNQLNISEDKIVSKIDTLYKFYKDKLDVYKYRINEKLPLLKVSDFGRTQSVKNRKINIKVLLPRRIRYANIYLFINKEKVDLYYSVNGGEYIFRNVRLRLGKNNIELFYTLGNIRSNSTSFLIIKE